MLIKIFTDDKSRLVSCSAGKCTVSGCSTGCLCWSNATDPRDCSCDCDHIMKPANKKGGKKGPSKTLKVTPQSRFNICARSMAITSFAQYMDKSVPNKILVPANKLTKKVNLSLKNKSFRQIILASGLVLKS